MTPSAPVISVLMPVRDEEMHLDEAISSVIAQTFGDFELIVTDDGSSDGTADVLSSWARREPRIRTIRQEPQGIVAALEAARSVARGRFLARMDGDDVALADRFERQLSLMRAEPGLVACGSGIEYFPADVVRDGARRYEEWINAAVTPQQIAREIFIECPLPHPTFFVRADALDEIGGYRDAGWPEDYDVVLRLWQAGGHFGKVPETLLRWREGSGRLSRVDPRYSAAAFRRCKVHYLTRTLLAGRDGAVIWGAGPVGKALAKGLQAEGTPVLAFVEVDPRKVGQEIHGAPVIEAEDAVGIGGALHLAAVGQEGARERIREVLSSAGLSELQDFVAMA
jgi:glycosyltransferase involved in cell wall biosynthesis